MKGIQIVTDEYLERTREMSPTAIARFLDDFRRIHAPRSKSRLISMKVPEPLLGAFRARCRAEGWRYQTKIKALMEAWLASRSR